MDDISMKEVKTKRKRKKNLLNKIREQIEFYFSDANLRHDRYMAKLVKVDDDELKGTEYVELEEFLKFNKISQLSVSVKDIRLAIESSKLLELDNNKERVRRITPFINKQDKDDCTIYVERLPPYADHDWIKNIFSTYGKVEYISLPRFKHNQNIMGFAFIEFDTNDAAIKICQQYANKSNQIDNEMSTNVKKFDSDDDNDNDKSRGTKRMNEDSTVEDSIENIKKLKVEEKTEENKNDNEDEKQVKNKEKKKKKRKRRQKEQIKFSNETDFDIASLRIMSKKEWKSWKNKYLQLQKATMSKIKKSLLLDQNINKSNKEKMTKVDDNREMSDSCQFDQGLIIRLIISSDDSFEESLFKQKIRSLAPLGSIAYIDLAKTENEFKEDDSVMRTCYIRCKNNDAVNNLMKNESFKNLGDSIILEGSEEKSYWSRINEEKEKQKNIKRVNKKVRGFDKLINKSEKIGNKFL